MRAAVVVCVLAVGALYVVALATAASVGACVGKGQGRCAEVMGAEVPVICHCERWP